MWALWISREMVHLWKKIHLLLSVTELIQSTFTEHKQWPHTLCAVLRRAKKMCQVQILTLSRLQFSWIVWLEGKETSNYNIRKDIKDKKKPLWGGRKRSVRKREALEFRSRSKWTDSYNIKSFDFYFKFSLSTYYLTKLKCHNIHVFKWQSDFKYFLICIWTNILEYKTHWWM